MTLVVGIKGVWVERCFFPFQILNCGDISEDQLDLEFEKDEKEWHNYGVQDEGYDDAEIRGPISGRFLMEKKENVVKRFVNSIK